MGAHHNFASVLDQIYNTHQFYSGTKRCGLGHSNNAKAWMSAARPPIAKNPKHWHEGLIGYPWWTQIPFIKCTDAEMFLKDMNFPPTTSRPARWPYKFLHLMHRSWLWARRNFSVIVPDSTATCKTFCSMEWMHDWCNKIPYQLLQTMDSLWVPYALFQKFSFKLNPPSSWRNTSVFMTYHVDRR